ncbi:cytochrome c oxidase assembly protein [Cupriavidus necator]|uniref:SURF1-like protein n=1 Tax=Cupriavidus necator TaxID=106590 RepID=A0A1U9UJ39_CUPNE|nr:SURF1 family protein [Cupriavidus necator]AQV92704.1 cytochrome c oxidase assembly protein [Cupriavidus necator]
MSLRRFFSPLPLAAALVVIAVTCALGNWQLNRAHEKEARAARLRALSAQPPMVLGTVPLSQVVTDRTVRVTGRFDTARTVLLDNRPHGNGSQPGDSRAGFLVLTPLRISGSPTGPAGAPGAIQAVLVLRGWLPRDAQDRTRIAPFPTPDAEVTIEGTALAAVPRVYSLGNDAAGSKIRQNVDIAAYAAESGLALHPLVLEQRSDTGDGLARDWAPADLGAERHYGYAFQWFGLAALTMVLVIVLGWRRARRLAAP